MDHENNHDKPQDAHDDIARRTLAHYEHNADSFFAGTIDHDVSQNIAALLDAIAVPAPYTILDLGCGPGRDLKTFSALGHRAIGVDGSERFVAMARDYSGCEVWHQDFLHLDLPQATFDGIFANAVLFHVPSAALPQVLTHLHAALKPGGVLFSSNPRGDNQEGWNGARYGSYYDYATWERYLLAAGFTALHHYYRPPGLPREQQPWLASVWRKPVC
ncbi:class I SAM-dependent methyltransferase [Massilia sp. CFBP9026]|uniref:class I SAM-dependent methyltransferase n=1 Tax=Massilia sp. CFBP9026 TaxID=3096536 RepID=UPI002A6B6C84|nr:class I SAM-dependent methyltransferase [Massilia sp. CFBP9026]MDY0964967.1 class I SAM-dependent methyltransferase [Massilia sp. CFBP9026]